MKLLLGGTLLILVLSISLYLTLPMSQSAPAKIEPEATALYRAGTTLLAVSLAITPAQQRQGLAGKKRLDDAEGMLFPFSPPSMQKFWNKGMLMGFDLVWIQHDKVIGIEKSIPEEAAGVRILQSPAPVDAVLEVSAGWVERHGLKQGDALHRVEK